MKKRTITTFAVLLSLLLSFYTNVPVLAGQARASQCLSSYSASATAEGVTITIDYLAFATSLADEVGAYKIVIQQKSGSSWSNVQTYESSNMKELLGYDSVFKDGEVTYNGKTGNQYRAIVTIYAKIGSVSDSRIVTTNTVSL